MKVDIDRKDIVSMLLGLSISEYSPVIDKIPQELGSLTGGGFGMSWEWNNNWIIEGSKFTDEELYRIYLMCKNEK